MAYPKHAAAVRSALADRPPKKTPRALIDRGVEQMPEITNVPRPLGKAGMKAIVTPVPPKAPPKAAKPRPKPKPKPVSPTKAAAVPLKPVYPSPPKPRPKAVRRRPKDLRRYL